MRFNFAGWQLDTEARELRRNGRRHHLSPKAFEVLTHLVEASPRALSKAELLGRAWPGVFVSDASLARVINEIRETLGERGRNAACVRTVHGYGYAFSAELDADSTRAGSNGRTLWSLTCNGREFGLPDGDHIIGRDSTAAVQLDAPRVSRHHARITVNGSTATIEDLNSKNGSFARGARITAPTTLASGDLIQIGPFLLIVRDGPVSASTETGTLPLLGTRPGRG